MGKGYGSEYHLHDQLTHDECILTTRIAQRLDVKSADVRWAETGDPEHREWKGMDFLREDKGVMAKWHEFWPQRGNPPNWDAIATVDISGTKEWLLFEAKANHPEFCSKPCGAVGSGRDKIIAALGRTKRHLGVHRDYPWEGTYYQYANRLACLFFLNVVVAIPARLVFVYFAGDCFPDGRWCPASEEEWEPLIRACHLTLGLREKHTFSGRVHEIFVPVHR
jgi:hypothetical protein